MPSPAKFRCEPDMSRWQDCSQLCPKSKYIDHFRYRFGGFSLLAVGICYLQYVEIMDRVRGSRQAVEIGEGVENGLRGEGRLPAGLLVFRFNVSFLVLAFTLCAWFFFCLVVDPLLLRFWGPLDLQWRVDFVLLPHAAERLVMEAFRDPYKWRNGEHPAKKHMRDFYCVNFLQNKQKILEGKYVENRIAQGVQNEYRRVMRVQDCVTDTQPLDRSKHSTQLLINYRGQPYCMKKVVELTEGFCEMSVVDTSEGDRRTSSTTPQPNRNLHLHGTATYDYYPYSSELNSVSTTKLSKDRLLVVLAGEATVHSRATYLWKRYVCGVRSQEDYDKDLAEYIKIVVRRQYHYLN